MPQVDFPIEIVHLEPLRNGHVELQTTDKVLTRAIVGYIQEQTTMPNL